MNWFRKLALRLRGLFFKGSLDRDLEEELNTHLSLEVDQNVRCGMSSEDARRAALRKFGGVQQTKESYRDRRGLPFFDTLLQDIRFGFRMLRKSPGFTAVAVLTLALGIGATTVIFSALNGIILRPLPYSDPSRIVYIEWVKFIGGQARIQSGVPDLALPILRTECPAIQDVATFGGDEYTLTSQAGPEKVNATSVSGEFFSLLGISPLFGRAIQFSDELPSENRIAVLSYPVWREIFGGDPNVIGRTIVLNETAFQRGAPFQVVGVMPPEFEFLNQYGSDHRVIWTPLAPPSKESNTGSNVLVRVRRGISVKALSSRLHTISARMALADPAKNKDWELTAIPIEELHLGRTRTALLMLFGAVGFVLLIACVNLSGLLLARGWTRNREVAIRQALGASRIRIVRQFLVESLFLALAGGILGLCLSFWGIRVLRAVVPPDTPRITHVRLDANVLWFAFGVSILSAILFGLAPALHVSANRLGSALKDALGGGSAGRSHRSQRFLKGILVASEIALAVVLVTGAGLLIRSFVKLTSVDTGYRTDHLLTMTANLTKLTCGGFRDVERCNNSVEDLLDRIRHLRGVQSVAAASDQPASAGRVASEFWAEGRQTSDRFIEGTIIQIREVSPDFFRTMGMQLKDGRSFAREDRKGSQTVAIVSESLARRYFSAKPLGRRLSTFKRRDGTNEWLEIVGEVNDINLWSGDRPILEVYTPLSQAKLFTQDIGLIVRSSGDPAAIASAVREQVWSVDRNAPITDLRTMDQVVAEAVAEPRFQAVLLSAFGASGLVLALLGIYGILSYAVSQRTREIGVRMALGARDTDVLRMVLREGMVLACAGIVIGIGGAFALTRLLRGFLYVISPGDPTTFASVAILIASAALAACYFPARRAARVDPMVALRYE
jgi:predicted permease